MRTGFATEKFCRVRCRALQYLQRREPGFFHQLKFTEESGAMDGPDVPGISAGGDLVSFAWQDHISGGDRSDNDAAQGTAR